MPTVVVTPPGDEASSEPVFIIRYQANGQTCYAVTRAVWNYSPEQEGYDLVENDFNSVADKLEAVVDPAPASSRPGGSATPTSK